ncbi:alpha,alpha-phosphotrehalase [Actinomyces mediterranea]|uniref:alpha,alpha-phosphotrehalase n=1 Tax=Actinomyces mediterranea TaxID=1871028 RepID=UPI0009712349|nr:alpha,alpha-phosphotrehalase [Actinomyces mediterranea]
MTFHDQTIYQIYPRSFKDSTGTGVGDLRGIIDKVPYIASLGVDMVWLNPFFVSPQRDNGYDIADYRAVNPALGTMEDFEELVEALGARGIGVMLDMVLNHTSTQHEWFQRALAGEEEYQDFYYLRSAGHDGALPNNWVSKFGGNAWAPFTAQAAGTGITEDTAAENGFDLNPAGPDAGDPSLYYLHLYDITQADLNWHNPRVRRELADVVAFWRDKGVRGFRFDVINVIGKPADLPSAPEGADDRRMYTDTDLVVPYLRELAATSFGQDPEIVTVGEMSSTSIDKCILYTNPESHALSMAFNFHHLKVDYADGKKWTRMPFDFAALKGLLSDWGVRMQEGGGWNALFWNNHDQPRANNRFGDVVDYPVETATMLASTIHLLRGTPYVYMGEEIGMTDPDYSSIEDYCDVEAVNAFHELVASGMSTDEAFTIVAAKARDNARTPMQWDSSPTAGFTSGTPWLRPTNQDRINVEAEEAGGQILPYYRRLIALRKSHPIIAEGSFEPYQTEHPQVFAYMRTLDERRLLVLNNFYGTQTVIDIPAEFIGAEVLISNYPDVTAPFAASVPLAPYQSLAILI